MTLPKSSEKLGATDNTVDNIQRRAANAAAGLRLLSTLPFHKSDFWSRSVETLAPCDNPNGWLARTCARFGLHDPGLIWKLIRRARRADAVLINGGERTDLVYLALAGMMPWIQTPHLIVDAHWQPGASRLHLFIQRVVLRLARRLIAEVQVHSAEEIDLYEQNFGLRRDVIRPLPWSTSLTGYRVHRQSGQGDAIVTGGHSYRDYPLLLDALAGQDWPVRIGLPASALADKVRDAANALPRVNVCSDWTMTQYWQQVADSRLFAMPIVAGLQRCTADQTILNAMSLGTIVVATDTLSSRLYITHGVTGFLVPEGDALAWRDTLGYVFSLPAGQAQKIREAAQLQVRQRFSEDQRLVRTLERAAAVVRGGARQGVMSPTGWKPRSRSPYRPIPLRVESESGALPKRSRRRT